MIVLLNTCFFSASASTGQVAGETEVLAQIKLKMRDVAGTSVVVTRRLQSSQKRKKLEMKTLEGIIQRLNQETNEVCMHLSMHVYMWRYI